MYSPKIEINTLVLSPIEDCGLVVVSNDPVPGKEGFYHSKFEFSNMSKEALSFVTVANVHIDEIYFYNADFIIYDVDVHKTYEKGSSKSVWVMTNISRCRIEGPGVLEQAPDYESDHMYSFLEGKMHTMDAPCFYRKEDLFDAARDPACKSRTDRAYWEGMRLAFSLVLQKRYSRQFGTSF